MLFNAGTATAQTTTVWSATLTTQTLTSMSLGCSNTAHSSARCTNVTVLTDDNFTHGGATYRVIGIVFQRSASNQPWTFTVFLDKAFTQSLRTLRLHLGNRSFSFASALFISSDQGARWSIESTFQVAAGNTFSMSLQTPPPPPPPVITSAEGVTYSGNANEGFSLTPLGEGGHIVYRRRTIDLPVTRDECPSPGDPAVIMSRRTLDRVLYSSREIAFELLEDPLQDPPPGFRLEGCAEDIDPGVTLGAGETVTVCLPPTEVQGKSYIHRYDGEWERLESRSETVNGEELVCGETDTFSLFGVFIPMIEDAQGVIPSEEDAEGIFSLTPVGEGGSIDYGDRTIYLSVTGDVDPSSSNPAVIVPRNILDRVNEITFELSEVSPQLPPSGLRLSGFATEVDLGVTLGAGETVSVCLPSAGGDIYRYSEVSGEWEVLDSRLEEVNGEEAICAETGAFSLTGVFAEETGGCAVAAAEGEGTVRWQGAVFNLLLTISVLLLIPGMSKLK